MNKGLDLHVILNICHQPAYLSKSLNVTTEITQYVCQGVMGIKSPPAKSFDHFQNVAVFSI